MIKYLAIFKIIFANATVYRFDLFFDTFQSFFTPFLMLTALSFAKSTSIESNFLLNYYLVVAILGPLIRPKVHEDLYEITRTGEVGKYLTKPISLYKIILAHWSSQKLISLMALFPFVILILGFNRTLLQSLFIIPLSFILYFNLSYLCGLLSFWIDEFWAISNLFEVSIMVLTGVIVPYQFFPSWFTTFLPYLPFPYTSNWLARANLSPANIQEVLASLAWICITGISCVIIERNSIKHYSLVGG